jgi:ADP-ribose pyrophosphatase YjhB (NUDIX family)
MEGPQLAVGAVVVRDDALLMVRRGGEPGKDLWSLPGGRVEIGEYISEALAREVKEETNVEVNVGELVGIFEIVGDDHHYVVLDFAADAPGNEGPAAGGDAAEARWVPLKEVGSLPCTPRFVETMRGWGILPEEIGPEEAI